MAVSTPSGHARDAVAWRRPEVALVVEWMRERDRLLERAPVATAVEVAEASPAPPAPGAPTRGRPEPVAPRRPSWKRRLAVGLARRALAS